MIIRLIHMSDSFNIHNIMMYIYIYIIFYYYLQEKAQLWLIYFSTLGNERAWFSLRALQDVFSCTFFLRTWWCDKRRVNMNICMLYGGLASKPLLREDAPRTVQ